MTENNFGAKLSALENDVRTMKIIVRRLEVWFAAAILTGIVSISVGCSARGRIEYEDSIRKGAVEVGYDSESGETSVVEDDSVAGDENNRTED